MTENMQAICVQSVSRELCVALPYVMRYNAPLFKLHYRNARFTLSVSAKPVAFYARICFKSLMNGGAERSRSLSVYNNYL